MFLIQYNIFLLYIDDKIEVLQIVPRCTRCTNETEAFFNVIVIYMRISCRSDISHSVSINDVCGKRDRRARRNQGTQEGRRHEPDRSGSFEFCIITRVISHKRNVTNTRHRIAYIHTYIYIRVITRCRGALTSIDRKNK